MATRNKTLEYLTTTKIGEKGQLTVPKQFREDLGLATGAPFAVLRLGDGLVLLPQQQQFENLCERVASALTSAGLTPEAILATLPCSCKPSRSAVALVRATPTASRSTSAAILSLS